MNFVFSDKANMIEAGIFAILNEKKEKMILEGREIYNLSVGTPDFPPAPHVMEAIARAAEKPENYKYAIADRPELLRQCRTSMKKDLE